MGEQNLVQFTPESLRENLRRSWKRKKDAGERGHCQSLIKSVFESEKHVPWERRSYETDPEAFMSRAVKLLPYILDMLQWSSEEEYDQIIYGVIFGAAFTAQSDRLKKYGKSVSEQRIRLKTAVDSIATLQNSLYGPGKEPYRELFRIALSMKHHNRIFERHRLERFDRHLNEIQRLLSVGLAYLGKPSAKDRRRHVPVKRNLARFCAKMYHQSFKEFPVTTPDSDFAVICSLMYEIATGRSEESFSKSINAAIRDLKKGEIQGSFEEDGWLTLNGWHNVLASKDVDERDIRTVKKIIKRICQKEIAR